MSYFTGTANTPSNLKALIEAKAVLAGWTVDGTWLNKGSSHVQLTATDTGTYPKLLITGANSNDGATEPTGFSKGIFVPTAAWPVTYYLHLNTTPEMIVMVIKYSTNRIQHIMFGDIVKIHASAFVGGNFFHATYDSATGPDNSGLQSIDIDDIYSGNQQVYENGGSLIPFAKTGQTGSPYFAGSAANKRMGIHCKIDTKVWDVDNLVTFTDGTISSLFRSPNTYNSQTHLVPMNIQFAMTSSLYGYLGYVEHVRLVRVENYEIGDLITISPDVWKVYPWLNKNTLARNGTITSSHPTTDSGTLGFAVRYTP